jgi:peptide/nickel transport system permease protein
MNNKISNITEWMVSFLTICKNNISLSISIFIISIYIFMAIIGPYIIPLDLVGKNPPYLPPSFKHPLGTDHVGRDILMQIVHGSRDVLTLASIATLFTILFSIVIGSISGLLGGKIDLVLTTFTDIILTIPAFPLQIVIAASIRGAANPVVLGLVIAFTSWASPSRSIRSQVMSIKNRDFVEASRAIGLNSFKILMIDILPLIAPYIIINGLIAFIQAIYSTVGLSLIGALPWSEVNWGVMINTAVNYTSALRDFNPLWYLLGPLLAIITLQLAVLQLSNNIEYLFNPRLRELYKGK